MARPRKLTDEQRLANNAARQKRWRERNRVFEKLRARNNRAKAKGEPAEVQEEPEIDWMAAVPEEAVEVEEARYVSFDEVEGYEPPVVATRPVATPQPVKETAAERAVLEWLAKRGKR